MNFISTRGQSAPLGFSAAFAAGLADDGGLFVPESLPDIRPLLQDSEIPYPELAYRFFQLFDPDHAEDELRELVERSCAGFENPADAAPLRTLDEHRSVLELFHGPTLAFKDFGLQLVGNLFENQIASSGNPINVLGATSGDTGSAAIHGLANKEGVKVFILYPRGRVSPLQERQM
ncbi:MAG: threonine synthase, partial [Verrucomicrobiales bacterium]